MYWKRTPEFFCAAYFAVSLRTVRSYFTSGTGVSAGVAVGVGPLRNSALSLEIWSSAPTSIWGVALPRTPRPRAVPILRMLALQIGLDALSGQALMSPLLLLSALMHERRFALVSSRESH